MFPHLNRSDGSSTFTSVGLKGLCKFFIFSFLYNFDFGEKWNVFRSFQVINCLTWCSKNGNVTVEEARFCDMFVCTIKTTLSLSLWSQKFTVGHSVYNRTNSVPISCKSADVLHLCIFSYRILSLQWETWISGMLIYYDCWKLQHVPGEVQHC